MSDKSGGGNENRGSSVVNRTKMCTGVVFTTLKLARRSSCSFTSLNRWAVLELLQLSHFHTPAHAYTLTRVSGLKCESEYRKEVEEHIIVCQTPLPLRPSGTNRSSWSIEILVFCPPPPSTHTHSGTLSPWQCFARKFRPLFFLFYYLGAAELTELY